MRSAVVHPVRQEAGMKEKSLKCRTHVAHGSTTRCFEDRAIFICFGKVIGSEVKPMLREGRSDRRVDGRGKSVR